MNEFLLEIQYLVDDFGDIKGDDDSLRLKQAQGIKYNLIIRLNDQYCKTDGPSNISINRGNDEFASREISKIEIRLLLEAVSKIKFSFESSGEIVGKIPRQTYSISIKRGTALMSFAWADGEYITNDAELLSSLMNLVNVITTLEGNTPLVPTSLVIPKIP
jgi:hypothetical protein